jgi:hypothetical protein
MVKTRASAGHPPHPTAVGRMLGANRGEGSWPGHRGTLQAAETVPEVSPLLGFVFWAVYQHLQTSKRSFSQMAVPLFGIVNSITPGGFLQGSDSFRDAGSCYTTGCAARVKHPEVG